jgi:hypothetical protein
MPYKMREMVSFAALAPRSLACIRPTRLPVLCVRNTMSKMLTFDCKLQICSVISLYNLTCSVLYVGDFGFDPRLSKFVALPFLFYI